MTVGLENWASVVAIVAALAGHLAITSRKFNALDAKIDHVRDEVLGEMRDGFGRLDTRLTVIEQRTYDLSLRLPPAPAAKHS